MPKEVGVTFNQAKRAARSLNYRRRLNDQLPELEGKLVRYIRQQVGESSDVSALIGPYKVKLYEGEISIKEVDPIDPNQLKFEFFDENVEEVEDETRHG
ncbi:hypothetical protein K9M78_01335 [Candidatus Bipolaricaulota bacterium]|nr:hypothetical protein [Candidatus Bipolaricaulota bacterium]